MSSVVRQHNGSLSSKKILPNLEKLEKTKVREVEDGEAKQGRSREKGEWEVKQRQRIEVEGSEAWWDRSEETGAEGGLESKTRGDLIPDRYSHQQLGELTVFFFFLTLLISTTVCVCFLQPQRCPNLEKCLIHPWRMQRTTQLLLFSGVIQQQLHGIVGLITLKTNRTNMHLLDSACRQNAWEDDRWKPSPQLIIHTRCFSDQLRILMIQELSSSMMDGSHYPVQSARLGSTDGFGDSWGDRVGVKKSPRWRRRTEPQMWARQRKVIRVISD